MWKGRGGGGLGSQAWFSAVPLHVPVQRALLYEGLAAHGALVRLLARVYHAVVAQVFERAETFRTDVARVRTLACGINIVVL